MTDKVAEAMEAIAQPTTNMTPQKRKLAAMVAVIKETTGYKLGHIDYSINDFSKEKATLYVWSPNAVDTISAMYNPNLAAIAELMSISAFMAVRDNRITLIIM